MLQLLLSFSKWKEREKLNKIPGSEKIREIREICRISTIKNIYIKIILYKLFT